MGNTPSGWDFVTQRPTTGPDDHGRYVQGQEIRIRTRAGHEGTVFVPYSAYSPEKVKPMLASLAARLDAVGSLSG